MNESVIIDLDKYLNLKNEVERIKILNEISKPVTENEYILDQLSPYPAYVVKKEIRVIKEDLEKFFNDFLGLSGYELKLIDIPKFEEEK